MAVDHLKAVGLAIKKSPRAIRKKFGGGGEQNQHEILDEDWYHSEDPVKSGVTFFCKYLGSMGVQKTHGPGSTEDAVKAIVQEAKVRAGKLQKVKLTVSSKFLKLEDATKQIKLDEIPLYRVSYCTVDPYYDKVFCYIARNGETKKLECHAYLCGKRSKAEAVTLTVAQAFNIAYDSWKEQKKKVPEEKKASSSSSSNASNHTGGGVTPVKQLLTQTSQETEDLLGEPILNPVPLSSPRAPSPTLPQVIPEMTFDLLPSSPKRHEDTNPFRSGGMPMSPMIQRHNTQQTEPLSADALEIQTTLSKAKSLNYIAVEDELDDEFQQLAEARSNPHLLDIGEVDRSQVSGDVKQYMLLGDRSFEDLSRSKSHDDFLRL